MTFKSIFYPISFFLFFGINLPILSQSVDSALFKKYRVVPNLTEEEFRFNQSNLFPLSLAQKGRLSTSAFRGMPPGFFELSFEGIDLANPVTGYWNEQWIPHWRIQQRHITNFGFQEKLSSLPPGGYKPETRVTYFQTNLSYLDIDFSEYFTRNNYIHLGGNNFLRDGPFPFGFSQIQVNTYQAQVHLQLFDDWNLDLFYWQMRHRFNMTPDDLASLNSDRFKQIGHTAWFRLAGRLSEKDSLVFIPNYAVADDDYWIGDYHIREIEYEWTRAELGYFRKFSQGFLGTRVSSRYLSNNGNVSYADKKEGDGRVSIEGHWHSKNFEIDFEAGGYKHSEIGQRLQGALHLAAHSKIFGKSGIRFFSKPHATPLTWRTLRDSSIRAYSEEKLIEKQGASFYTQKNFNDWFLIRVEPFAYRTQNYPVFVNNVWERQAIENYGVHFFSGLKLWRFWLQNDFTYNHNYEESFAPQVNNVSTVKSSLSLFKGALKFEGILVWHVLGYYRLQEFDRLLQQFRITQTESGSFYLADFRLQAHISRFTLFMVWENLLSEDYSIVEGTLTQFRTFRIGLHWLLFN